MTYTHKRLYRSRNGKIFGVCRGIADWRNLPVEYIRLFMILAFIFTGFFPVGLIYFLAAMVLPMEPEGSRDYRFSDREYESRSGFDSFRRDAQDLKDRVSRMESRVFDKEKNWDERFRKDR